MVADAVEKQIVTSPSAGEILLGVINDRIRAGFELRDAPANAFK